jgi:condensin complex subunit 1
LNNDNEESFDDHKRILEIYGFLLFWLITDVENKINSKIGVTGTLETTNVSITQKTKSKLKQSRSKSTNANSYEWDWNCQKEEALSLMKKIMTSRVKRVWTTTHERETFIRYSSINSFIFFHKFIHLS